MLFVCKKFPETVGLAEKNKISPPFGFQSSKFELVFIF